MNFCSACGPLVPPGPPRRPAGAAGAGGAEPVGTAVVRKMRSPQTTGDELPLPGTVTFQAICSVSLQCKGASPAAIPSSLGPRQWGQPSTAANTPAPATSASGISVSLLYIMSSFVTQLWYYQ